MRSRIVSGKVQVIMEQKELRVLRDAAAVLDMHSRLVALESDDGTPYRDTNLDGDMLDARVTAIGTLRQLAK